MWVRRQTPERGATVAGSLVTATWAVFAGVTAVLGLGRLLGVTPSVWLQSALYLALMLGISLPHGGFEHVENLRGRGGGVQARYVLAYLLLVAGSAAVFLFDPLVGLGLALAITAAKGGHGGLRVLETVAGADHLGTRPQRALAAAVRGGAVVVVPLLFHPGIYYMVAGYMVGVVDPGAITRVDWAFAPATRAALGGVFGAAVLAHLGLGYARSGAGSWRVDAFETLLLVAFFAVVPPILAIGVYFPCWYATRQVARLSGAAGTGRAPSAVPVRDALARFARRAAPPWVGSVLLLAGLAQVVPRPPSGVIGWMAFYSVFVAVIAVPHVVVGAWLDRRRGIWAVAASGEAASQR